MEPTAARCLFPLTKQFIFLNHAGVSPLSERAKAAVGNLMEQLVTRPYPNGMREEEAGRLRQSIRRLVGAPDGAIRLVGGTLEALTLLAESLGWRSGDNVVAAGESPASTGAPWTALRGRGVEYRPVEPAAARLTPDHVLGLVDGRTRLVVLSHVEPVTGYRVDLESIGSELRQRGIILAVDAGCSAGALRLDLARLPVDFACAPAHKWLLGPQGIGFCYFAPGLIERSQTFAELDEPGASLLEMAAFAAGVGLLLETGPEQVERQVLTLARRLSEGLAERGYKLVEPWPREAHESSGIVSFGRPGSSPHEVLRDLTAARVVGRTRGDVVRLSPHFYNTGEEVDHVLDVLAPGGVGVA